jgi:outer membrane protein TolC
LELQKEVVKTDIPTAQVGYLDIFNASYFYRPSERTVVDPINPYSVNGLQLGVTVSLGNLLAKPFAVKRAKAQYKIAELQAKDYDIELETLVKTRYYDYILSLGQLKIATQNAQESKGVAESLRKKFEKSEITLDAYNQSRIGQTTASTTQITAEVAFLKAKDALEDVIGVKLSEVK